MRDEQKEQFGMYVFACFQMVGLQDVLRQLNDPHRHDTPARLEEYMVTVTNTFGSLYGLRDLFMAAYDRCSRGNMDDLGFTDAQKESLQRILECKVGFRFRSDGVIVYAPLLKDRCRIPARVIYAIMSAASMTLENCLSQGSSLQCEVDIGFGMEAEGGQFCGPQAVKTTSGERHMAFPKVAMGEVLHDYLIRADTASAANDYWAVLNRRFTDHCLAMVQRISGMPIVNHTGC